LFNAQETQVGALISHAPQQNSCYNYQQMKNLTSLLFFALILLLTILIAALIYLGMNREVAARLASIDDAKRIFSELGGPEGAKPIVMFTADWCSTCAALSEDLHEAGVSFIKADIEKDPDGERFYELILGRGGETVPLTMVGTRSYLGYQRDEILGAAAELE
jgi:glutaredoxin